MKTKESFLLRPHFSRQLEPKLDVPVFSVITAKKKRGLIGSDVFETDNVMPNGFGLSVAMGAGCFSGVLNDSFTGF